MTIANNIVKLKSELPKDVTLVAVSKFKSNEDILEAYHAGQTDFGENYVQELVEKAESLPEDIRWHFIGHLQSNKVKYIVPFVYLIHSVDSLKLLKEINKQAGKIGRIVNCLLQVHIAEEETKTGFSADEFLQLLEGDEILTLENVRVVGVMGMSTFTDDMEQVKAEFAQLSELKKRAKNYIRQNIQLRELSMGMSGDWPIAVEEGSTMVRIGSTIFGVRN